MKEKVLINNIRERFEDLEDNLITMGVDGYFEELFYAMQSDNDEDILMLNRILTNEQLRFLADFDYQFYSLVMNIA